MDNNALKEALLMAFSEEAPEILQKAESALLDVETAAVADQKACLDGLKRALHSLKGSASAIGNAHIRDVCHAMEELLLKADYKISPPLLDMLYEGHVYLQAACAQPDQLIEHDELLALFAVDIEVAEPVEEEIVVEKVLAVEEPAPVEVREVNNKVISSVADNNDKTDKNNAADKENRYTNDTIRVAVNKIENMQSTVGELVAIRLQQNDELDRLIDVHESVDALNQHWQQMRSELYDIRQYLPSQLLNRIDRKMAAVSNQVKITQRQTFQLLSQARNQLGQLTLLSDEMDLGLRSIRMMPVAPFLESFRAVARDAARQLDKKVVVECVDKGIEIDRLVIEKLKEPIMHLVRNSIGHGIEPPQKRLMLGKPEEGHIRLSAELSGDYVYLQIIDDGAGFNRQGIVNKAVQLGLMSADEDISDEKLLTLVSMPGFSTAGKADMISGRGVGMDVVATILTEIGGKLELETQEGMGSCFTLQVPSSLATTQGLILQIGNQRFGIALEMVERIVRSQLDKISIVEDKQVLYVDGEAIAVVSLAGVLQVPDLETRNTKIAHPILLLKVGNQRLALIVDDIPGEIPLIIKSMGPQFENIAIYSGGNILSDGSVLPILNARQLIAMVSAKEQRYLNIREEEHYDEQATNRDKKSGIVVVVDDSITTRTLERNILEAAGYTVSVATDGIEALDVLMYEDNVSLLITDLEMPRMNGLELCRRIRSGKHAALPIIMVTSLGNEEEKRRGIEAGADAYIVKSEFQQEYFLEMVDRFVQ